MPAGCGRCQELGTGRALAQQPQDEFGQQLAQARRLPAPLREAAQQARDNMAGLHRAFVLAGSLRELAEALVTQGHKWVAQAWEVLEASVEFLLRHPQEPWQEGEEEHAAARTELKWGGGGLVAGFKSPISWARLQGDAPSHKPLAGVLCGLTSLAWGTVACPRPPFLAIRGLRTGLNQPRIGQQCPS